MIRKRQRSVSAECLGKGGGGEASKKCVKSQKGIDTGGQQLLRRQRKDAWQRPGVDARRQIIEPDAEVSDPKEGMPSLRTISELFRTDMLYPPDGGLRRCGDDKKGGLSPAAKQGPAYTEKGRMPRPIPTPPHPEKKEGFGSAMANCS